MIGFIVVWKPEYNYERVMTTRVKQVFEVVLFLGFPLWIFPASRFYPFSLVQLDATSARKICVLDMTET